MQSLILDFENLHSTLIKYKGGKLKLTFSVST